MNFAIFLKNVKNGERVGRVKGEVTGERASCPFVVFFNALERDALGAFFQTGGTPNAACLTIFPERG
jgi:hypothetical protein